MTAAAFEQAAAAFRPRTRRWPTPGAMARHFEPTTRQTPALLVIDEHLVGLYEHSLPAGEGKRLLIAMPPQEGKSQRTSRWFPAWLLSIDPTLRIGLMSYSSDLAVRWGRAVRRLVNDEPDIGVTLRRDTRRANEWETIHGGGMVTVGRDSGLTGRPLDVLIVDDPFSSQSDAMSAATRENVWSWWESVAVARLSPRGIVVVMNTRWHEDDLSGRLARLEPGRWTDLRIPAIADSPDDPLGRPIGEEMVSAQGRAAGYFHDLQQTRSPFVFAAVWQQRPAPLEGGLFQRASLTRYWRHHPQPAATGAPMIDLIGHGAESMQDVWTFLTVDVAGSVKTTADYTVAAAWAVTRDDQLILLDRVRARVDVTDHYSLLRPLVDRWQPGYVAVEDSHKSMTVAHALGAANIPVKALPPEGDKVTRAIPAANRAQTGGLWLPAHAPWLDEFLDEVLAFPNGSHDDQVDVLAYAALELALGRAAPPVSIPTTAPPAGSHHDGTAGLRLSGMGTTSTDYTTATW